MAISRPERIEGPRAADYQAARRRHQLAMEGYLPVTVTIDGTDYVAAGRSAGELWEVVDGGIRSTERCVVMLDKRVLRSNPGLGSLFAIEGKQFKVAEVGGVNGTDESWVLRGMAAPGV